MDDVQETFLRVFNLAISPDSYKSVLGEPITYMDVEDTKGVWYYWELPGFIHITLDIAVDLETDILQGIHISQPSTDATVINPYTAEQVLETLGTPSSIYMSHWGWNRMNWFMVYEYGLVLEHSIDVTIYDEADPIKALFCLGEPMQVVSYYIVPPFSLESGDLEPIHREWFLSWLTMRDTTDVLLGLSAEEITTMAQQTYNPCFTIEKPD